MRQENQSRAPVVPVVLAGGRGVRLWPVSREARPKHFLRINRGHSLLQSTLLRAASVADDFILLATNEDYFFQTEDEVRGIESELGDVRVRYLLEHEPRNTGPAVCMAARYAGELAGEDAVLLVLPSDHLISDDNAFQAAVERARQVASSGRLVTFGVKPSAPETAFGYVERGDKLADFPGFSVTRFVEKPRRAEARQLIASDRFAWNAGIFSFTARAIDHAFATHASAIHRVGEATWQRSFPDERGNVRLDPATFAQMPEVSLDYAVLEKAADLAMVETEMDWADIGTWQAMTDLVVPDGDGNKVLGDAVLIDCSDTYVQSDGRLVAVVGADNLVIVDTPDALLVGSRDDLQKVRNVVERLRLDGHEARVTHRTVHRPWGTFTVVEEGEKHKIKRLRVKPGRALSLQMHYHRSEHWVVLEGIAHVVNGAEDFFLEQDRSTYIPAGNQHRLENPGDQDLVVVETQTGSYLGEDDIVRFDDDYGRAPAAEPSRSSWPPALPRH